MDEVEELLAVAHTKTQGIDSIYIYNHTIHGVLAASTGYEVHVRFDMYEW